MSEYLGEYTPGKAISRRFNTHKADGTPIALAGSAAISVYKSGTDVQSTAGVSLTVDYDSVVGLNNVAITTVTDGTFYAAGNDFDIVITTGTVDSVSVVGTVVGTFSLSNRAGLRPSVADATIIAGNLDAAVSTRLASASYTAPLDAAATRAAVGLATANLDTQLAALAAYVDTIETRLPAALVSGRIDANMGAATAGVITAAALASDALVAITDSLLKRDWTSVSGEASRSVLNALRKLRNHWAILASTLTVTKEDDVTLAYTQDVGTTAGADPITSLG